MACSMEAVMPVRRSLGAHRNTTQLSANRIRQPHKGLTPNPCRGELALAQRVHFAWSREPPGKAGLVRTRLPRHGSQVAQRPNCSRCRCPPPSYGHARCAETLPRGTPLHAEPTPPRSHVFDDLTCNIEVSPPFQFHTNCRRRICKVSRLRGKPPLLVMPLWRLARSNRANAAIGCGSRNTWEFSSNFRRL